VLQRRLRCLMIPGVAHATRVNWLDNQCAAGSILPPTSPDTT
jgi:hypothetical protein